MQLKYGRGFVLSKKINVFMLTVKQIIFSTLLRFCNGALYLAELWNANDRLTAAGKQIFLKAVLECMKLEAHEKEMD